MRSPANAMTTPTKRAFNPSRLTCLGRESHASQSAIEKLLRTVREEGIPDAFSRASQYRARKKACAHETAFGRLVETMELPCTNGNIPVGIVNPRAILSIAVGQCEPFSALFARALRECPLPWRIILYTDGVTPQDALSKVDRRKLVAVYWSFMELGPRVLSTEEAWFVVACVRAGKLAKVDGGLSRFLRDVLEKYFSPPDLASTATTSCSSPSVRMRPCGFELFSLCSWRTNLL